MIFFRKVDYFFVKCFEYVWIVFIIGIYFYKKRENKIFIIVDYMFFLYLIIISRLEFLNKWKKEGYGKKILFWVCMLLIVNYLKIVNEIKLINKRLVLLEKF